MLSGYADVWSIRLGRDFRLCFRIQDRELLVLVVAVANRRDVYKLLARRPLE